MKIKVARIFNTYGPTMLPDDGRVISNFIVQALLNEPITIYGKGSQSRSFCYVNDMVRGLILLMGSEDDCTGPVNLGNPHEITMLELANRIIQITASDSKLVYKPLPTDDPLQRRPDITLAETILKWHPQVNLDDGLNSTINYFKTIVLDTE